MVAGQRDESERLLIAHMHGSYDAAMRYRARITELEDENERLRRALITARLMSGRKMPPSDEYDKAKRLADALSQARLELDGKARITSLLSGRQQSEPSPDADLIAPNSIDDTPPDPLIRVDEIEEAYHSADDSKLVFKEVKP